MSERDAPILPREIRTLHRGRVFTVTSERITLPNGHDTNVEVIRHPGSVVLVPVLDDGRLMLVRQYRHAIGQWVWELPAGTLKSGEAPEVAAARECQEEIGLIPGALERLASLYPTPGFCDEEMTFFRATGLRAPGPGDAVAVPDDDEDIQCQPFTLGEVVRRVGAGEMVDMKTAAALALLTLHGRA